MSFNFGPTVMSWLEVYDPDTYRQIIAQDQANVERWGVGNAIAQAYNHTILPLAGYRDKVTQISWGIRILNIVLDVNHSGDVAPRKLPWTQKL